MQNDFWDVLQQIFWHPETAYRIGGMLLLTGLLMYFRNDQRSTYRATMFIFLFGICGQIVSAILHYMGFSKPSEVLYEISTICTVMAAIRQGGFVVFRLLLPTMRLRSPQILEDLAIFGSYLIYAIARIKYAGVDLSGILALSAVTTAVIAFAMQDTLGNVLGGLAIQFDNSIQVGDYIKVGEVVGKVANIRWRSTAIETNNWETVVIPNAQLMKNSFAVLGRRIGQPLLWRRWVYFNVDPSVTPGRVISTVEAAVRAAEIPEAAKKPQLDCIVVGFEDGSIRYGLRYWLTDLTADSGTDSLIRINIFTSLQRAGVRISEPQQTVHMIQQDEEHASTVHEREIQRGLKALREVELFASLEAPELRTLASRLKYLPYAKGDVIIKQGAAANSIYIIASGEAEVFYENGAGAKTSLRKLGPGRFFGEMGLMTGEPRGASVVAISEALCYTLDKNSFKDLIETRPQIADEISKIISSRQYGLSTAQQNSAETSAKAAGEHRQILEKIRQFFGLSVSH